MDSSHDELNTADQLTITDAERLWGGSVQLGDSPGASIKEPECERAGSERPALALRVRRVVFPDGATKESGDFEVTDHLGEGGMGVVLRARQVCADRDVAVKMIRPEAATHGSAWVSFLSEAMVTADLDHPNIVPIHDIGTTQDGFLFYAMKEVRGTCWKDVMGEKNEAENLEILLNVCDAVAFAHSKGIVHRDLKPENVMLGDYGEVLVMDWGLAVGVDAGGKAQHVAQDSGRAGTPAYMAPEMARCESARIGPASDIYLLGGILYEIATGLRPHHADNIFACIYQAMENEIQGVDQSTPDSLEGERPEGVSKPKSEARECGRGCPQPRLPASESRRSESASHFDRSRTSGCETTSPRESSALSPGVVADGEGASRAHAELTEIALTAMASEPAGRYGDVQAFQQAIREYQSHAESVALAQRARTALERGNESGNYDDFAQALFGFREALTTWPKNKAASRGESKTGLAYATCAFRKQDLDLAMSLLDLTIPSHLTLSREVRSAIAERTARRKRLKTLTIGSIALTAAIVIVLTIAFFWIRAEQARTAVERDRAIAAEKEEARQRATAVAAREETLTVNRELVYESYVNLIAVADARIRESAFDKAEELLWQAPRHHRGWEWGHLMHRCHPDLLTLRGHTREVHAVAFSPDGRLLATGGYDGKARIWDVRSGELVRTLPAGSVECLAFSPDGECLITAGSGPTIQGWDLETCEEICSLTLDLRASATKQITSVAFLPDGRRVVAAAHDGTVRVCDLTAERELMTLDCSPKYAFCAAVAPDGRRLAGVGDDRKLHMWDANTGEELWVADSPNSLSFVTFSPDGQWLVTIRWTHLELRRADTGELDREIGTSAVFFRCAVFSPDGNRLATGEGLGSVKIWNVQSGKVEATFTGHGSAVYSVAFSPDGRLVASASGDRTVKFWDAAEETDRHPFRQTQIECATVSGDGRLLLTGNQDGTAELWDIETATKLARFKGHTDRARAVAFGPGHRRVLTGSLDKTARIWDAATGEALLILQGHESSILSAASSPDGQRIVTASTDGTVMIWNADTGKEVMQLPGRLGAVYAVAFSADGSRLASGHAYNAMIWDAGDGRELMTLGGHTGYVLALAFSADGERLATGDSGTNARIWGLREGRVLCTLKGHNDAVSGVGFHPDGTRLVTGSYDRTARIWDTESARELLVLAGHTAFVRSVAFLPDGQRLMTAGTGTTPRGNPRIWSACDWTLTREQLEQQKLERYRAWVAENVPELQPAGEP